MSLTIGSKTWKAEQTGRRPQDVGIGRKRHPWLKDGDNVEVGLGGVGSCMNRVRFIKEDDDVASKAKI